MKGEHLKDELRTNMTLWDSLEKEEAIKLKLEYLDSKTIFVYHKKAAEIIKELKRIFRKAVNFTNHNRKTNFSMNKASLIGMSIVGHSGSGKSETIQEFIRIINEEKIEFINSNKEFEQIHVIWINLPPVDHGIKGLYEAVLAPFFKDPDLLEAQTKDIKYMSEKDIKGMLQEQVANYLRNGNTMVLFIDEFQNLWDYKKEDIDISILESLKLLGSNGWCVIVPSGVPKAMKAIKSDPEKQLIQRCPIYEFSKLDFFYYNAEFLDFIEGFEEQLPFWEPSNLMNEKMSELIFTKAISPFRIEIEKRNKAAGNKNYEYFTNVRYICEVILRAAEYALEDNATKITEKYIDQVQMPNDFDEEELNGYLNNV